MSQAVNSLEYGQKVSEILEIPNLIEFNISGGIDSPLIMTATFYPTKDQADKIFGLYNEEVKSCRS